MEVALMLVSLPLMLFCGFELDALGHRDDDKDYDDEDDDRRQGQASESGHPPII